ncbi:MAG: hypothetical protein WC394_01195, partial [Candidatus Omnitrophota bacterium]
MKKAADYKSTYQIRLEACVRQQRDLTGQKVSFEAGKAGCEARIKKFNDELNGLRGAIATENSGILSYENDPVCAEYSRIRRQEEAFERDKVGFRKGGTKFNRFHELRHNRHTLTGEEARELEQLGEDFARVRRASTRENALALSKALETDVSLLIEEIDLGRINLEKLAELLSGVFSQPTLKQAVLSLMHKISSLYRVKNLAPPQLGYDKDNAEEQAKAREYANELFGQVVRAQELIFTGIVPARTTIVSSPVGSPVRVEHGFQEDSSPLLFNTLLKSLVNSSARRLNISSSPVLMQEACSRIIGLEVGASRILAREISAFKDHQGSSFVHYFSFSICPCFGFRQLLSEVDRFIAFLEGLKGFFAALRHNDQAPTEPFGPIQDKVASLIEMFKAQRRALVEDMVQAHPEYPDIIVLPFGKGAVRPDAVVKTSSRGALIHKLFGSIFIWESQILVFPILVLGILALPALSLYLSCAPLISAAIFFSNFCITKSIPSEPKPDYVSVSPAGKRRDISSSPVTDKLPLTGRVYSPQGCVLSFIFIEQDDQCGYIMCFSLGDTGRPAGYIVLSEQAVVGLDFIQLPAALRGKGYCRLMLKALFAGLVQDRFIPGFMERFKVLSVVNPKLAILIRKFGFQEDLLSCQRAFSLVLGRDIPGARETPVYVEGEYWRKFFNHLKRCYPGILGNFSLSQVPIQGEAVCINCHYIPAADPQAIIGATRAQVVFDLGAFLSAPRDPFVFLDDAIAPPAAAQSSPIRGVGSPLARAVIASYFAASAEAAQGGPLARARLERLQRELAIKTERELKQVPPVQRIPLSLGRVRIGASQGATLELSQECLDARHAPAAEKGNASSPAKGRKSKHSRSSKNVPFTRLLSVVLLFSGSIISAALFCIIIWTKHVPPIFLAGPLFLVLGAALLVPRSFYKSPTKFQLLFSGFVVLGMLGITRYTYILLVYKSLKWGMLQSMALLLAAGIALLQEKKIKSEVNQYLKTLAKNKTKKKLQRQKFAQEEARVQAEKDALLRKLRTFKCSQDITRRFTYSEYPEVRYLAARLKEYFIEVEEKTAKEEKHREQAADRIAGINNFLDRLRLALKGVEAALTIVSSNKKIDRLILDARKAAAAMMPVVVSPAVTVNCALMHRFDFALGESRLAHAQDFLRRLGKAGDIPEDVIKGLEARMSQALETQKTDLAEVEARQLKEWQQRCESKVQQAQDKLRRLNELGNLLNHLESVLGNDNTKEQAAGLFISWNAALDAARQLIKEREEFWRAVQDTFINLLAADDLAGAAALIEKNRNNLSEREIKSLEDELQSAEAELENRRRTAAENSAAKFTDALKKLVNAASQYRLRDVRFEPEQFTISRDGFKLAWENDNSNEQARKLYDFLDLFLNAIGAAQDYIHKQGADIKGVEERLSVISPESIIALPSALGETKRHLLLIKQKVQGECIAQLTTSGFSPAGKFRTSSPARGRKRRYVDPQANLIREEVRREVSKLKMKIQTLINDLTEGGGSENDLVVMVYLLLRKISYNEAWDILGEFIDYLEFSEHSEDYQPSINRVLAFLEAILADKAINICPAYIDPSGDFEERNAAAAYAQESSSPVDVEDNEAKRIEALIARIRYRGDENQESSSLKCPKLLSFQYHIHPVLVIQNNRRLDRKPVCSGKCWYCYKSMKYQREHLLETKAMEISEIIAILKKALDIGFFSFRLNGEDTLDDLGCFWAIVEAFEEKKVFF